MATAFSESGCRGACLWGAATVILATECTRFIHERLAGDRHAIAVVFVALGMVILRRLQRSAMAHLKKQAAA
jgi:hypothetical protein